MPNKANPSIVKRFKWVFLGAALMVCLCFGVTLLPTTNASAGSTEALLLSCIDYRLINETEAYMAGRGLRDKYDHVILAGASLGVQTDKYPAWGQTFYDHVDVAIKLHNIHKVIVLDHRDCGAYRVLLGHENLVKERDKETKIHMEQMTALADNVQKKFPALEVELLLIDLDGKVEKMGERKAQAGGAHH
jgi:carbonic anhydrase